jgi:hypothetical protein
VECAHSTRLRAPHSTAAAAAGWTWFGGRSRLVEALELVEGIMGPGEETRVRESSWLVGVLKVVNIVVFTYSLWFFYVFVACTVGFIARGWIYFPYRIFLGLPDWAPEWIANGFFGFVAELALFVAGRKVIGDKDSLVTRGYLLRLPALGMVIAACTFVVYVIIQISTPMID